MAQNNRIDFIRNATIARDLYKQPTVLDTALYTNLKSYSLSKNIPNTKISASTLLAPVNTRIFNMDIKVTNCTDVRECINTNARANRHLQPIQLPTPTYRLNKVYTPNCCTFINGQVTKQCVCSKKTCKYGTAICG